MSELRNHNPVDAVASAPFSLKSLWDFARKQRQIFIAANSVLGNGPKVLRAGSSD